MRVYEELEKEANERDEKFNSQIQLITRITAEMKQDLGPNSDSNPFFKEIEALEKEVKNRLLTKLLT